MVIIVNGLLVFFAIIALAISAEAIYNFEEETSFFSKQGYLWILSGAVFTILLGGFAIWDITEDHDEAPNKIFVYWCIVSGILVVNMVGFYYFQVFFGSLEVSESNEVGQILQVAAAKELQDSILSSYTRCCSGCDASRNELKCKEDIPLSLDDVLCNSSAVASDANAGDAECLYALPCDDSQGTGLGDGCYAGVTAIPSYPIGSDSCKFLTTLEFDDKPLVGSPTSGSCGGGDPKKYLQNVKDFILSYRLRIQVGWGFLISLLFIASIGSCIIIACPRLRYKNV